MKKIFLYPQILIAILVANCISCVEDEGNYELEEVNEITIKGIEKEYDKLSYIETLEINPELSSSIKGKSEEDLEFRWFVCSGSSTLNDHRHETISTQRNLNYKVDVVPGTYVIYYQVTDKNTGLKFETSFLLNAISSFMRGFYLYGNKADGTVGMDFVSMPTGRDTLLLKDIFVNTAGIKGAKDLIFTGHYDDKSALWAVTEDGQYAIEYSAQLEMVDIIESKKLENLLYPTMSAVKRPFHLTNISPDAYGEQAICRSRSNRILMTENEIFASNLILSEAYGNPINRDNASTSAELFKPFPYAFYRTNMSSVNYMMFYDMTNHRFMCPTGSSLLGYMTYCTQPTDSEIPFYLDQKKYAPVRQMVYGENGYGNAGRSYALMTDANSNYYVYGFLAPTSRNEAPTKLYAYTIDKTVAIDFDRASHYAFFSMQSILLYCVGSRLYAYDYTRNECKLIIDYGDATITYLAMEHNSTATPTDFVVATYSNAEKGTVSKYTLVDDVNKIEVKKHEKEVWKTDLKVVKVVWKYSSY